MVRARTAARVRVCAGLRITASASPVAFAGRRRRRDLAKIPPASMGQWVIPMIFQLFRRTPRAATIASLYGAIVARERTLEIAEHDRAPDTVNEGFNGRSGAPRHSFLRKSI